MPLSPFSPHPSPSGGRAAVFVRLARRAVPAAALYYAAARLSLEFILEPQGIAAFWPASGVALAFLVLAPLDAWLVLVPVLVGADLLAAWPTNEPRLALVLYAAANIGAPALAAYLIRRWPTRWTPDETHRSLLGRLVLAAALAAAVGAALGAAVATMAGRRAAPFFDVWVLWWLTDAVSMTFVTATLIAWRPKAQRWIHLTSVRSLEATALMASLLVVAWVIFGAPADHTSFRPFPYAVFPLLIWAAMRFGSRGASVASLVIAAVSIWNTARGSGPFAVSGQPAANHLLQVQLFVAVVGMTGLAIAAILNDRQRMTGALQLADLRFRALIESSSDAVVVADASGRVVHSNPAAERIFGRTATEMIGAPVAAIMPHQFRQAHTDALSRLQGGGAPRLSGKTVEVAALRRDGSEFPIELSVATWVTPEGRFSGAIVRDVSDRKAMEGALRESENRHRVLFEESPIVMMLHDPATGRIVDANPAACAFYGYSRDELRRMHAGQINTLAQRAILAEMAHARSGERRRFEFQHRLANGDIRQVDVFAGPITLDGRTVLFSTVHDATMRRQMEAAVRQAQRLESLATLAGGVAHDFNNQLTVVLGHTSAVLEKLHPAHPLRSRLEKAVAAAERAAAVADQMRAYSGRGRLEVRPLDLSALVQAHRPMLEPLVPPHVRLQVDGEPTAPLVEADGDQIRQALSALVTNAAEAIGDRPATVTISTSVCTIDATSDEWWRHTAAPLDPGQYVVLSVEDEGCGVDPATVPRMFDPFFTTKFPGRGLGLAAVLGIVRAHRGGIAVHSQPGRGTRVEMALPVPTQGAPAAAVES